MPLSIEEIIEKVFEQAFLKALDQTIQAKAEALFKKALENGSPLSTKLAEKIEQGFDRFVQAPTLPSVPAAATATNEAAPKKKRPSTVPGYHKSEQVAFAVASTRTKGARRVFAVTYQGKTRYCTCSHIAFVGEEEFKQLGGGIVECGKTARAPKIAGVDGVMAAVNALPEEERNKVLAQLKANEGVQ
jgi:hypothetical protein